jgi:hypothetical protein
MRLFAFTYQTLRGRWARLTAEVATATMLTAVAVLALVGLAPGLFSVWGGSTSQVSAGETLSPLTFDAPRSTVLKFRAAEKDAGGSPTGGDLDEETVVLLDDWKYTQRFSGGGFNSFFFFSFEEFLFASMFSREFAFFWDAFANDFGSFHRHHPRHRHHRHHPSPHQ